MYRKFYGLKDTPFRLAPDPKYLYRTESMLEVLANLQYGVESAKGLVVVTGEVGTGKTTILRSNLQAMDRSVLAAYIFNPILSIEEFYDTVAGEFRLRPERTKSGMLRRLGALLMSRHQSGLSTVLVIDEAHLLPDELLEEVRLLSNFETNREKLLQIILCGQPELDGVLSRPELRQLRQRVSLRCSIQPLTANQTGDYIAWRLRIAGCKNDRLFEPAAIRVVHQHSGGIPRIINNVCDNALLTGFSQSSPTITASMVDEVIDQLDPQSTSSQSIEWTAPTSYPDQPSAPTAEPPYQHTYQAAEPSEGAETPQVEADPLSLDFDDDHAAQHANHANKDNVHYLRRNYLGAEMLPPPPAYNGGENVRLVIEFEGPDRNAAQAPANRFFSRVKVSRG